jgi:hypothetical protein
MLPVAIECSSSRSQGSQRSEDKKGSPGDTLKNIDIRTYPSVGRALERRTNPHNGYGYDIYINGKLYVHQPYMQGGDNNTPFPSEEGAKMTADFLIFKLKKHIIPPTVSQAEVDSLITR